MAVDELNPLVVQIVRSVVQTLWTAALGIAVVSDFFKSTGLDQDVALGVALAVSMALVLLATKALNKVHPIFGWLLSGINRPPEYEGSDPKTAKAA